MDNTRTIISSSIISIIIVAVGLFLLCVRRAPKINTDDSFTESNQYDQTTASDEEQQLLDLLGEASDEMALQSEQAKPQEASEPVEDDGLAALLAEGENSFNEDQFGEGGEDMDDIMSLLDMEESERGGTEQFADQSQDTLYQSTLPEFAENETTANDDANQVDASSIDKLKDQVDKLENVLADKQSEKQNLMAEIESYDRQIAELESQTGGASQSHSSFGQASNYEASSVGEAGDQRYYVDTGNLSTNDFKSAYDQTLQLFYDHRYEQAANQFFKLLQSNPLHKLADNCQYWIGECRYAQGRYYQAIAEFTKVSAFDAGDKKDDAQLMIGLAFMKLGENKHAQTELDWLVSTFASSEYINKAYWYLDKF